MMRPLFIVLMLMMVAGPAAARYRLVADLPAEAPYADSVIRVTASRLETLLGPVSVDSLDIFIVATSARFDSLAGNTIPDWGAGVAILHQRRIVIKSPAILPGEKSLRELVAHEYTHIATAAAVGYRDLPRWFDEGIAMYLSAEWSWDDNLALGRAVIVNGTIPLTGIENLNRFPGYRAQVAYATSFMAFKYFLDVYGQSGLHLFLSTVASGGSMDAAFVAATGSNYAVFEIEFAKYLQGRYNIVTFLFDTNLLWILLALVAIAGFIVARLRRRKRIEQLDEYDKYHSSDFDYGEVEKPDEDKPWD